MKRPSHKILGISDEEVRFVEQNKNWRNDFLLWRIIAAKGWYYKDQYNRKKWLQSFELNQN